MKRFIVITALCSAILLPLAAQDQKPAAPAQPQVDTGYALGLLLGANVKSTGLDDLNIDEFLSGFKAGMSGAQAKVSTADAQAAVQAALVAAKEKKNAATLAAGKAFLATNGKKAGVKTTASGLEYEVLVAGKGAKPAATDTVKVNYEGKLLNGTVFDSSYERGEPVTFPLSGIIPGWTEALQLMPVGSKYRLYLPSELAYGEQGAGDVIEPNAVLIFEVELLGIEPPEAPAAAGQDSGAAPGAAAPANK